MAKNAKKVRKPNATDRKHKNAQVWRAEDEITLRYAIDGQITHINEQISRANTPGKKAKLRDQKKELRAMRKKVDEGIYGSTSLYAQLERAGVKVVPKSAGRNSVSRYDTMDFKFDEYFRKTRYYGGLLPFLLILFTILMFVVLVLGTFLPAEMDADLNPAPAEDETAFSIHIDSLYMFKLSPETDFLIANDGKWPLGLWAEGKQLEEGELFYNAMGSAPSTVRVYGDLGMTAIKLSLWDVTNAFFRTPAMSAYKIDPIENLPVFDGANWYYAKYLMGQDDYLSFGKQADGTYNTTNLIYIIAVYGTIIAILGLFVTGVCAIVSSIVSMFTYTGRRLHFYAIFMIIFLVMALILPAFLAIPSGTEPSDCLGKYILFDDVTFLTDTETNAEITLNFPIIIALVPAVLVLILPKLLKNRPSTLPTYVPKGNRPPTPALVERAQHNEETVEEPKPQPQQRRAPAPRPAGAYPSPYNRPMGRPMGAPMGRPMGRPMPAPPGGRQPK